ncbi:MAG: hypothetical protein AB7F22_31490 [Reyranella sp.]|uniref:hypothetical protein n=1 Tax=Reyranella sp. TaxID=1929291 RepID=UPI003D0DA973
MLGVRPSETRPTRSPSPWSETPSRKDKKDDGDHDHDDVPPIKRIVQNVHLPIGVFSLTPVGTPHFNGEPFFRLDKSIKVVSHDPLPRLRAHPQSIKSSATATSPGLHDFRDACRQPALAVDFITQRLQGWTKVAGAKVRCHHVAKRA